MDKKFLDKKFLDKVVDQIISETTIEDGENNYVIPFRRIRWAFQPSFTNPYHINKNYFIHHCKTIYGLNDDETEYVFDQFKLKMNEFVVSSGVLNQPNNPTF